MKYLRGVKTKIRSAFTTIRKNPLETIELFFSLALLLVAIAIGLPTEWLPRGSVYSSDLIRLAFGVAIGFTGGKLLYWRVRHGINKYIALRDGRKKMLFFGSLSWLYLGTLRIISAPWYPPFYVMYLALFAIGIVCCVRLLDE